MIGSEWDRVKIKIALYGVLYIALYIVMQMGIVVGKLFISEDSSTYNAILLAVVAVAVMYTAFGAVGQMLDYIRDPVASRAGRIISLILLIFGISTTAIVIGWGLSFWWQFAFIGMLSGLVYRAISNQLTGRWLEKELLRQQQIDQYGNYDNNRGGGWR